MVQRSGQPLPRSILLSMNFLQRTALKNVGIFRRSGMKSRIEKLKEEIESRNSKLDFESYSPYDIADMLKLYLRELPEPVLTSKLAETFISIYKGNQSTNQLINQSINTSINQAVNQLINHPINQSTNQSVDQLIIQAINQSSSQWINQSINQSFISRSITL